MNRSFLAVPLLALACDVEGEAPASLPDDQLPPPLSLTGDLIIPGARSHFVVTGAAPGDTVYLLRGTLRANATCPPIMAGVCLDLLRPQLVASMAADANGVATFVIHVPASIQPGLFTNLQAATTATIRKSNTAQVAAQAGVQVTLFPVADASVLSNDPSTTYGTGADLVIQPVVFVSQADTLLKFDLSAIPMGAQIGDAQLSAFARSGFAYGDDGTVYLEGIDDAWDETTVTWANAPAPTTAPIGSWWLWFDFNTPGQLGVADQLGVQTHVAWEHALDGWVSLRLRSPGYHTLYNAHESGAVAAELPQLTVTYVP